MNVDVKFGFVTGIIFSLLFTLAIYHIGESICQQENNVADCGFTSQPFIPYTAE